MNWFYQDAVATALALGAVLVLVRRVASAVAPARGQKPCEGCPSCPDVPTGPSIQIVQIVSDRRR